jgi:hypothetical protein
MARRTRVVRLLLCAASVVLLIALTGTAEEPQAGDKQVQSVPITTVDGVELVGTYYRGRPGRDTPCVLMIHRLGSDSSKSDWIKLAQDISDPQKLGFAVLTFDLRGHGKSTTVEPQKFWTVAANKSGIKGTSTNYSKRTTIEAKEFQPRYLPMLVNDVLAARRFLEIKNDAGEVNTNSLFVIGAQEGAALGMFFTAEEFTRVYKTGFVPLQSDGTRHLAGEDIAAGIWLSLPLTPNQVRFNAESWLRTHPAIREKVPMCFVYGEKDTKSQADAKSVLNALTAQGREKHKLTNTIELKGTDLAGGALLGQQVLDVNGKILKYMQSVMEARRAIPWTKVDPEINKIQLVALRSFGF